MEIYENISDRLNKSNECEKILGMVWAYKQATFNRNKREFEKSKSVYLSDNFLDIFLNGIILRMIIEERAARNLKS